MDYQEKIKMEDYLRETLGEKESVKKESENTINDIVTNKINILVDKVVDKVVDIRVTSEKDALEKNGKGEIKFHNGDVYEGEWVNNNLETLFWGKGKYTHKNGSFYDGEWQNGMRHGQGVHISVIEDEDGGKEKVKNEDREEELEKETPKIISRMSPNEITEYLMNSTCEFEGQACASAMGLSTDDWRDWKARRDMTAEEKEALQRRCNLTRTYKEKLDDLSNPLNKLLGYHYYGKKSYAAGYTILSNPGKTKVRKMDTSKFSLLTKGNGMTNKNKYNALEKQTYDKLNGEFVERYVGNWEKDQMNGNGTMYYSNGDIYIGNWRDGEREGFGKMKYADGTVYEGEWENDEMGKKGTIVYPEKIDNKETQPKWKTYSGEHSSLLPNGTGEMHYNDDSEFYMYKGDWKMGDFAGKGELIYRNGRRYNGTFKDGKKNGKGNMIYEFTELEQGCYDFVNPIYEGEWKDGKREGDGAMNYENGDKYIGKWSNDEATMDGTYFYENGNIYIGEWKDDKREGHGELQVKETGSVFKGTFSGGKIKKGVEIDKDGKKFEGEWNDDLLKHGCFKITDAEGEERNTYFSRGVEKPEKYREFRLIEQLAPYECAICYSKIQENITVTECGHKFHSKCIFRWMADNTGCPYCRKELR